MGRAAEARVGVRVQPLDEGQELLVTGRERWHDHERAAAAACVDAHAHKL
jgi:hypothetical protein